MDVEILSRIQFAFTVSFHYIYPPLSIGLGLMMVLMEGAYLKTGNKEYETLARFWTKIFAITFGLGVATGIVMEFEFGTNWATYSRFVGDVFGSALAAEGLFCLCARKRLFGCAAVWLEQGETRGALHLNARSLAGIDVFGRLDCDCQQLATNAGRLPHCGRGHQRQSGDHRLLGHGVQPFECRSHPAHLDWRTHCRCLHGDERACLVSAQGPPHRDFEKAFTLALFAGAVFFFAATGHWPPFSQWRGCESAC